MLKQTSKGAKIMNSIIKNRFFIAKAVSFSIILSFCLFYKAFAETSVKMVPESFSSIAETVGPAVVNIRTLKIIKREGPVFRNFYNNPFGKDNPMDDLFKRFFEEERQKEHKQKSLGSGFIIDKEGYIITNNHVVKDADEIKVRLKDGKEFDAEIIGRDADTDIAVIQIKSNKKDFYASKLGDSDKLKTGEWVVAIGSPFGLEQTVTAGIVSAKGRVIGSGPYDNFIQTDASINFGNSGGPLINMNGEVIGINTAIIYQGHGIGFAIPINMVKKIVAQLKKYGEYKRGWLGVKVQDITDDIAEYYDLKDKNGVFVAGVIEGDPADKAGINAKDIIIEIDGKKIKAIRELLKTVADIGVGDIVKVKVLRDGIPKTFQVQIAKREQSKTSDATPDKKEKSQIEKKQPEKKQPEKKQPDKKQPDKKQVEKKQANKRQADEFGIVVSDITKAAGVIIIDIESGKKGEKADLKKGDIITGINRINVTSVDDYKKIMSGFKKNDNIRIFIKRKKEGFLIIKIVK
jgi:serine protease Do